MIKVKENIFVGNLNDCLEAKDFSIVHCCKNPCHLRAVGYTGNLDKSHQNYLVYEDKRNLFLNLVDAPFPLSPKFGHPMFAAAFRFIDNYLKKGEVLLHCNQGHSRGPSLALAYMAMKDLIDNESYEAATADFKKVYPTYEPGKGIAHYLENNWSAVMGL